MKYQYIKKAKLSRAQIAKSFGFANVHSFNCSSASKRYMNGVNEILRLTEEVQIERINNSVRFQAKTIADAYDNFGCNAKESAKSINAMRKTKIKTGCYQPIIDNTIYPPPQQTRQLEKYCNKKPITGAFCGIGDEVEYSFIEGLRKKGFEFNNKAKLENFIKSNCKVYDNVKLGERTYFVNDIPFFLYRYRVDFDLTSQTYNEKESSIFANIVYFTYL